MVLIMIVLILIMVIVKGVIIQMTTMRIVW